MTSVAAPGSYRAALRVREFDGILLAFLISVLGDSAAYLAVTVLVFQRTHSPLLASLTFAVAFAPYLLGGTLLSGLVDRLRPKMLLVGFDLTAAALVAVMVVPHAPIPLLYVILFAIGTMAPVRSGTSTALVTQLLPGDAFVAGRSALRICAQLAQILGIGLGGGLVAALGPRGALGADAASFLVSAALLTCSVHARPAQGVAPGSVVRDSLAGVRAVWRVRAIRRVLLLQWALPFISVIPEGLAAPGVAQAGAGPGAVALWLGAIPVGVVVGDLLLVSLVPPRHRTRLTVPLGGVLALVLLAFALRPPLPVVLVLLMVSGMTAGSGLGLDQLLRDRTPPALLGRVYTVNGAGSMVTQGVGFATAGAVAQVLSVPTTVALAGVLALCVLLAWGRGLLRHDETACEAGGLV